VRSSEAHPIFRGTLKFLRPDQSHAVTRLENDNFAASFGAQRRLVQLRRKGNRDVHVILASASVGPVDENHNTRESAMRRERLSQDKMGPGG